jgi:hypothetical protein
MDILRLKGAQGSFALGGDKGHEPVARSSATPDRAILERSQIPEALAVNFDPVGVWIAWRNRFRGWEDSGLPQVADEAVEDGPDIGDRRKLEGELRQKRLDGQGDLRNVQRTSRTEVISKAEQVGRILLHRLGRVTLRGQISEIARKVLPE